MYTNHSSLPPRRTIVYTRLLRGLYLGVPGSFPGGLPGGGKFRGVLVGVIAEEFCGVEMAVHGAGVAAVFREDEGALLCPAPAGGRK